MTWDIQSLTFVFDRNRRLITLMDKTKNDEVCVVFVWIIGIELIRVLFLSFPFFFFFSFFNDEKKDLARPLSSSTPIRYLNSSRKKNKLYKCVCVYAYVETLAKKKRRNEQREKINRYISTNERFLCQISLSIGRQNEREKEKKRKLS